MKLILLAFSFLLAVTTNATTYYISPSGNDATGTGTITNPWKTLYKACNTVTGVGNIIHVTAGTYNETQRCNLAVGVSIEGEGTGSYITSTAINTEFAEVLSLYSAAEGTDGNQQISNLKFDGQMITYQGIKVIGRKNVAIHDCYITNYINRGIIFSGRTDNTNNPPTVYATGNSFYNNTVINCAEYDHSRDYGAGCLNIGGQMGIQIYNNTITQNSRPEGYNGWPIKGYLNGFIRGGRIYNNILTKKPLANGNGGYNWDFCIELFDESGLEIDHNTIRDGGIDCNHQRKGNYAYSVWIHDNDLQLNNLSGFGESAVTLEFHTEYAIVENNTMTNYRNGIIFTPRPNDTVKNVTIQKNLMSNINGGYFITMSNGDAGLVFDSIKILNNTMVGNLLNKPNFGVDFPYTSSGSFSHFDFKNNNEGNANNMLRHGGSVGLNGLAVTNNNFYGYTLITNFVGTQPSAYTYSSNLTVTPLYALLYTLLLGSPLIDAGVNVGLPFNGNNPDIGYAETGASGNIAPTANAGADQTITLPTSTVSLSGSGTDPDGTIASYTWTKISGPTAGTITNSALAATTVTGLVQGVYKFELKVTDNNNAVGRDTMQVTVNPDPNVPPTANAGPDQAITLPTNSVSLSGSGTDPDGTVVSYAWTKVSGPTAGTITNAAAAATTVTGMVQGTYKFELKVTDNGGAVGRDTMQVIVNAAPNVAPTANAGPDQTITLPTSTVSLSGSGNDPDGTIAAYAWTKISGPTAGTITNAAAAATTVTGLVQGVYKFELKVTDNSGAVGRDTMQVTVNPDPNIAPTANAGPDQAITLPTNSVSLSGSGNDPDGTIVSYAWTKISGPTAGTITNAAAAATTVTGMAQGTYKFELKVTDNSGAVGRDTMQVIVNPAPNVAPTANAGADQVITLPTNSVSLSGSGNDPDGTIVSYAWTKISGPTAGTITNATAAATTATGLVQGVYKFELKVTDNGGLTATDTMQVTVNPAPNVPPVANAGNDITITLPTNSVTLNGSGTDADGTITGYLWTKISGPAGGTISNATAASTTVTGLTQGVYSFVLRVTDNSGATDTDTMQVTVNPAPNIPPVANAGTDISITLPTNSATLNGSGTDADGTVVAYLWTKISGPAGAPVITNPNSAVTTATGFTAGIYKFELKVTDNNGATDVDTVQVVVFAPNIPPTANAGLDQSITLPTNFTTLSGSGNDVDGTIIAYSWIKVSGPANSGTISNPAAAVTNVTGYTVAGVYVYQLRVTDNNGATATDLVQVTVNPENIPPVANAGPDQFATLPNSTVTLNGSGTDVDGTVVSYKWRQISGPADKLTSPNSAVTVLSNLILGSYKLELTVTDNKGATGKDTVNVTVDMVVAPDQNAVKVYPNPVVSNTTLDIKSTTFNTAVLATITDMNGKMVYQKKLVPGAYTIKENLNLGNLSKGTYFVTVYFNSQVKQTVKIEKQ
ncbi:PKD domain-containing protein [Ferruginibacter sp.]